MIISLKQNQWLYDWMQEKWHDDFLRMLEDYDISKNRPNHLKKKLVSLLKIKGYKARLTKSSDIMIAIPDDQFIFLKLTYG